ncbi:Protein nrde2 [Rhizophlyctis rosea]|uniref:Protein nrde2 n=1 Tax=Rhizophlyctis rosea TaxID=64517 RepID=A0AAD5S870_9FUNG|nr:Protein nrde2 [Rhizophlyctis rosea]
MKRLKQMAPDRSLNSESNDFIAFPDFADVLTSREDVKKLLEDGNDAALEENAEFVQKTGEFNRRLQEEPKNLDLWLQFVALQDDLGKTGTKKASLRTAIGEKKQAILIKALEALPNNETLLLSFMKICEDTWEAAKAGGPPAPRLQ